MASSTKPIHLVPAHLFWAAIAIFLLARCFLPPTSARHETFKVMTYNIHHGEGRDGKVNLPRIAELIQCGRADLVALQEVDKGVERTAGS
jgi:hypothetical protein